MRKATQMFVTLGASVAMMATPAFAQTTTENTVETAKPSDSVSPYGVSYHTGSFTYSVPLFTIGNGEWPNQITVSLDYDSSGARYPNDPWTLSIQRRVSGTYARHVTGFEGDPLEDEFRYGLNVVAGNASSSFYLGGPNLSTSQFESSSIDGDVIEFTPGPTGAFGGFNFSHQHGQFKVITRDGTLVEFPGGKLGYGAPVQISGAIEMTMPNGNVVEYSTPTHWSGVTSYTSSSTGLFFRMFGNQICAFNGAVIDPNSVTSCSQSPLVATITTSVFQTTGSPSRELVTAITRPDGGTYNFEYQSYFSSSFHPSGVSGGSRTRYHLSCVKEPGQSACVVQNTYDPCDGSGFDFFNPDFFGPGSYGPVDPEWTGSRDRVISQTLADGRVVSYAYTGGTVGPSTNGPCDDVRSVTMTEAGAVTRVELAPRSSDISFSAGIDLFVDPLGRETSFVWTGANPAAQKLRQDDKLSSVEFPDGRQVAYSYDSRGNRTQTRLIARPGSNDTDIVTSASFPANCTNQKTCNKATSVTDGNGNTSTFTYSSVHGGMLTSVSPAVDGVAPAVKYLYVQREAWLRNGGGYAKTGAPVWLLSEERTCRTSALNLSSGTCAGGAGDLVRTTYDYGPDSGPNNLWVRGVAVIADGQTLRSCYSYDELGRRISETKPKAGLATCQ